MSLNILQKFIECLKEQNPEIDDLNILIALRAIGLRGSEIYSVSPQIATKYQRLKEVDASINVAKQSENRGETERPNSWEWWLKNPSQNNTTLEEPDQRQN